MEQFFNIHISFLFDPLSVFFLAVIFLISAPSALYSVGYLKGHYPKQKIILVWALLVLFVASMALVVSVNNALAFLIAWELMSLLSYFLVIFDSEDQKSIQAGTIYIVMTHIGTAFITAAFLIMYKYANSFDFTALTQACRIMPAQIKNTLFAFLLIGFGTKAGIAPLHIWLPYVHPQAPSHISSIMSGVMIKTAIYAIIRFIMCIIGVDSIWWGYIILIIAAVSSLVGIIYALMEHDIKKLLAYSSVENVGVILFGIGAAFVFLKANMPILAVFSLAAGLYHLVNHAIFKGLLFLCAGSVYNATGTRDMEKLGGLIKLMPWTGAAFLVGAMAISAMPPLNGFVSEWLILQSFFIGALNGASGMKIYLSLCAGVLALTGGLAAACFVKAFGITFLAMPRSQKSKDAKEAALSMKIAMAFLAILCLAFGLGGAFIFKILIAVTSSATAIKVDAANFALNNFVIAPQLVNGLYLSAPLIAVLLLIFIAGAGVLYFSFGRNKIIRYGTWDCGYYKIGPRNEYTATAFSKPFRIAFNFFLLPYKKTQKLRDSYYHVKKFKYEIYTTPVIRKYIYYPVLNAILAVAKLVSRVQPGSIHLYISYIFIALLTLIIFMQRI